MSSELSQPEPAGTPASLTDLVDAAEPSAGNLPRSAWIKAGVIVLLFVVGNFWQLQYLVSQWRSDVNWSHGFLIPLFSLYLLYTRWDALKSTPRRACAWGLPLIVLGIVVTFGSFMFLRVRWFSELSMLLVMLGLVLYLGGPKLLGLLAVPILYLGLSMPLPERLYEQIAIPLQTLAAKSATVALSAFGAHVESSALKLTITSISGQPHDLVVAEACSGMRSLMAFLALSVAMAYVEPRPAWQRITLIVAGFPIAVLCNILRVILTATMFVIDKPQLGQKVMHELMGMVLLVPALLLLILLNRLLDSFYVEEDDDEEDEAPAPTAKADEGGKS